MPNRHGGRRAAVTDEWARIAREFNDVVGHAVNVMTVHALGVRRLLGRTSVDLTARRLIQEAPTNFA